MYWLRPYLRSSTCAHSRALLVPALPRRPKMHETIGERRDAAARSARSARSALKKRPKLTQEAHSRPEGEVCTRFDADAHSRPEAYFEGSTHTALMPPPEVGASGLRSAEDLRSSPVALTRAMRFSRSLWSPNMFT